jgi:hypothetical protein
MLAVLQQLESLEQGGDVETLSIGRIIAYQFEMVPNEEIQDWCDAVLAVWTEAKKAKATGE